jgi:hypothetical protein
MYVRTDISVAWVRNDVAGEQGSIANNTITMSKEITHQTQTKKKKRQSPLVIYPGLLKTECNPGSLTLFLAGSATQIRTKPTRRAAV